MQGLEEQLAELQKEREANKDKDLRDKGDIDALLASQEAKLRKEIDQIQASYDNAQATIKNLVVEKSAVRSRAVCIGNFGQRIQRVEHHNTRKDEREV